MSSINLVSCLMNHGKSLAKQLDIAKTMFEQKSKTKTIPKSAENNIYNEVEKVINGLMKDLGELDDDEYTTKECFDKVVRRTISSLEELKKHDDPQYATGYEALVTRVGKFLLSTDVVSTHGTSTPAHNNNGNDNEDIDFNLGSYKSLDLDKQFLLDLFAMLPRGTNIKKNDLVLWWFVLSKNGIHLDPIKDDGRESDFEKHLRGLVEMKMIEPVVAYVESVINNNNNNKREGVKYRMPNVIWSKFQEDSDENNEFDESTIKKRNSLSLSLSVGIKRSVVNTDGCNLTTERLKMLKEHYLWMLQLGNWNHDPRKYIVVEDVDSLSTVLNNTPLEFLSLEGVSGLVILPFFKGTYLRVLNIKGCHNLESLPQFNTLNMRNLEYLDMSECYQLDHPANVLKMEFDCYDMMKSFPKLHRLEMSKDVMYSMLRRSFQKATGTNDQNSGWEPSLTAPTSPPSAS